jgi:hypothetical protein
MPSKEEEAEKDRVMNTLAEFVRILVKEYPLVFKDGSGDVKIQPFEQPPFPYEVSLEIKKREFPKQDKI